MAANSKSDHDVAKALSEKLLQKARDLAAQMTGYDSGQTRHDLRTLFSERFGSGAEPYQWQLDVTEAMLLGLDSVVIAGTGSGKTIPFMLPLLLHPEKMVLVLSPLKILQRDQARRFKKMKIPAVAVNGDTWSLSLSKALDEHQYQAILTSPEMCLKHPQFRKWLLSKENTDKIMAVIIDEAHCISQWGGDFRPSYAQLEKLRSFMPPNIPVLLTSATLPPAALSECCARMNVVLVDSFFLNLGNHRQNIVTTVLHMDGSNDYKAIYDILPDPNAISSGEDLPKTIIFTNSVNATQHLCRDLRQHYGYFFHPHIDFLHAHRTAKAKRRIMKLFRQGMIKLLIATEAAGMGADIPDIELVIQFGVPSSLSVFSQRAGRSGRSACVKARAILLAEKSMFKRKKKKRPGGKRVKKPDESSSESESDVQMSEPGSDDNTEADGRKSDDGKEWGKKVDETLRQFISTTECRTAINDSYFNNPPRQQFTPGQCDTCDNCQTAYRPCTRPTTPDPSPPHSLASSVHSSPSKSINQNGKRTMSTSSGPATRRAEHLKKVRAALLNWRFVTYERHYSPSPFTSVVILPDSTLTALASNARIKTLADMQQMLKPPWVFASLHGQEVLDLLEKMDIAEKERRLLEKLQRREQKKEETALRRDAEKQRKSLGKSQPNAQRAPISRGVLVDSAVFNALTPTHLANMHYPHINYPLSPTHMPSTSAPAVHSPVSNFFVPPYSPIHPPAPYTSPSIMSMSISPSPFYTPIISTPISPSSFYAPITPRRSK
ncbi:hypothetical protein M378DRAFT_134069 [Amanita muscaria Koide BX008]|uniref:DNA 3'-5' helicase n=1 Tax=Amanita muscaria (strain Koide BX008) TaxID=946122 RepID=A0A0C2W476_AMAMK|nr:hypothetical protein M378DRAFT_28542 [Amanita muscaria Koide BX008]KIL55917.1 hypothetical protein M378DRAFT_134069 [Amanita muscaria Koide BX008]